MFMTGGTSQSGEESGNYPETGAKTIDYSYLKKKTLPSTFYLTHAYTCTINFSGLNMKGKTLQLA